MAGWKRTLFIMFFAQMVTAVGFSSIFPFLPLYVADLGSASGLSLELLAGLVFSAQAFTMMLASPIWGTLADRYGRKLMVMRAMFGGTVILLLMGFARSAEELVALRAIQGFITGTVSAANALVAAETPRGRKGFAMGLLQAGLGGGVALGPVLGGAMADAFGYRAAFYLTALLLLVAGLLVWAGVRENARPARGPADAPRRGWALWGGILATPGVKMTYGLRFLVLLGRMMITPIAPLFIATLLVADQGVNTFTGLVIGAAAAATTLTSGPLGRLGDRLGHRRVALVSTAVAGALYIPQAWVRDVWQLLAMQALVGVAMGGVIPAISALLADYTQEGEEGAVYGLDNSINAAARTVAPLAGAAVAFTLGLRATFVATALLLLAAALLAWWRLPRPGARKPYVPWSKTSQMEYK